MPALEDVLGFMQVLWTLDNALQSASKQMAIRYGITGPQRLAVRIIGEFPGLTTGHLALLMRNHPSTLTGVLRRLAERGLIEQVRDPTDKRRILVHLTAAGRTIDQLRTGTAEASVRASLEKMSERHVAIMREGLEAITLELQSASIASGLGPRRSPAGSRDPGDKPTGPRAV